MRRTVLSNEELEKIRNLRQIGTSWLKIQQATGIHRQTAKRAYERWIHGRSVEELKEARKQVATAEFEKHMNSLVALATSLVIHLRVPSSLIDMERDGEQFFSWLWEQDLLDRSAITTTGIKEVREHLSSSHIRDPALYRHEQQLLFESLKVHTDQQVNWKYVLDKRWTEARGRCANIMPELRKRTESVVSHYANLDPEVDFSLLKGASINDSSIKRVGEAVTFKTIGEAKERIVEVLLNTLWKSIVQGNLGKEGLRFKMVSRPDGYIRVKSEDEPVFSFKLEHKALAQAGTRICNLAYASLQRQDLVGQLQIEVQVMKKVAEELGEKLIPIRLRPIILRTQCDLCPV